MEYRGKKYLLVEPEDVACEECDLSEKPECGCCASEEMKEICCMQNIVFKEVK